MTKLRGAVIGCGYFSDFHFDAWQRIAEVEIVACCDQDLDKANAVAQKHGVPAVFDDYRKMLDSNELDFVDIVTRPDSHLEIVTQAAQRQLNVICQKPLAPDTATCQAIVDIAEQNNVRLMVHENFRFQPWYREIKNLLDQGTIGDKLHTISFRNRAGDGWGDDAYLARQPYFQTMEKFLVFEAGIHTVDTFRYLAGDVSRVWCQLRKLNPVIAGEDAGIAIFEFADGSTGLYDANRFNESTAENPRYTFGELLVESNGGSIRLYDDGRLTVKKLGEQETEQPYQRSNRGFASDCVLATQQHFADGLISGDEFETSGRNYLKSLAVQDAMYRSAETGIWQSPTP